jgi:hypothetical protein
MIQILNKAKMSIKLNLRNSIYFHSIIEEIYEILQQKQVVGGDFMWYNPLVSNCHSDVSSLGYRTHEGLPCQCVHLWVMNWFPMMVLTVDLYTFKRI